MEIVRHRREKPTAGRTGLCARRSGGRRRQTVHAACREMRTQVRGSAPSERPRRLQGHGFSAGLSQLFFTEPGQTVLRFVEPQGMPERP